jgi:hypothetical protein
MCLNGQQQKQKLYGMDRRCNVKNWIKRAIRTFFQSAMGYIVVAIPTVDWNDSALKTTLIGIGISS